MNYLRYSLFLILILLLAACHDSASFENVPAIEFISVSKTDMIQSDLDQDSLLFTFSFTDGDGDLGYGIGDSRPDIFIIDSRTNAIHESVKLPEFPDNGGRSISGNMHVWIYSTCCFLPFNNIIPPCSNPPSHPTDSMYFELYIKDRAGNESNRIQSSPIILHCK